MTGEPWGELCSHGESWIRCSLFCWCVPTPALPSATLPYRSLTDKAKMEKWLTEATDYGYKLKDMVEKVMRD